MRAGLIGVKDVRWNRFDKRDLLLCDRIAVPDLDLALSGLRDLGDVADLEWLAARDVVFDVPLESARTELGAAEPLAGALSVLSASLLVLAGVARSENGGENPVLSRLVRTGVRGFHDYSVRMLASHVQKTLGARSVPFLLPDHFGSGWDVRQDLRGVMSDAMSIMTDYPERVARFKSADDRATAAKTPAVLLSCAERAQAMLDSAAADDRMTEVVRVVLAALPIPSETTPLDELIDFVNTSDARGDLVRLRRWMARAAAGEQSEVELAEELEFLLATYREHVESAERATAVSTLEVVLTIPLEVAERVIKLQWSKIPEALIRLQRVRLSLREAERASPGREVALILKAQDRF